MHLLVRIQSSSMEKLPSSARCHYASKQTSEVVFVLHAQLIEQFWQILQQLLALEKKLKLVGLTKNLTECELIASKYSELQI